MSTNTVNLEELLHDYFIQNGSVTLPGVGTFRMLRISAQVDFASRKMLPPSYTIRFDHRQDTAQRELFDYVAQRIGSTDLEAIRQVNSHAFELRNQLLNGSPVSWEGFGTILPDAGSGFQFEPERLSYNFIPGVSADRVIRQGAEHSVRVGDQEKSRSEMEEILTHDDPSHGSDKSLHKAALIMALMAISIMILRFVTDGNDFSSSRFGKLHPVEAPVTYTYP